jgi:hypothetical protein
MLRFSTLFFACAVFIMAIFPGKAGIGDTDFWWHIAYGRWMLENGTIPQVDSFSWTFVGQPYQLTQWLGELLMGVAFLNAGFPGTLALGVLVSGATLWFAWRGAALHMHPAAAIVLAVATNTIHFVMPMRPQLFSFLMVSIWAYLIASFLKDKRTGRLWMTVPLMALWVNLHGGFVVGLLLTGILAAGQTAEWWMAHRPRADGRTLVSLWLVPVAGVAAACANPYGYHAITNVIMIGGLQSAAVIAEWQPVSLVTTVGGFFMIASFPFFAGAMLGGRVPLTVWLLAAFLVAFGAMANRQVPILAAGMAPFAALMLSTTAAYMKMLPQFGDPRRPLAHGLALVGLVAAFLPIHALGMNSAERGAGQRDPVAAADFLVANGLTDRLLCDTLEASYLIWRRIPVYVDGRMDLYRDPMFFEYLLAAKGNWNWSRLIENHKPQAMLLRNEVALRQVALASGEWRVVFGDEQYSVLVRSEDHLTLPTVIAPAIEFFDAQGKINRPYRP